MTLLDILNVLEKRMSWNGLYTYIYFGSSIELDECKSEFTLYITPIYTYLGYNILLLKCCCKCMIDEIDFGPTYEYKTCSILYAELFSDNTFSFVNKRAFIEYF